MKKKIWFNLIKSILLLFVIVKSVYSFEPLPRKYKSLSLGMTLSEFSNLNLKIDKKLTERRNRFFKLDITRKGVIPIYLVKNAFNIINLKGIVISFCSNKLYEIDRMEILEKSNEEYLNELKLLYGEPSTITLFHEAKSLKEKEKKIAHYNDKIKKNKDLLEAEIKNKNRKEYIKKYKDKINSDNKRILYAEYDSDTYRYIWKDNNTKLIVYLDYRPKGYKLRKSPKDVGITITDIDTENLTILNMYKYLLRKTPESAMFKKEIKKYQDLIDRSLKNK